MKKLIAITISTLLLLTALVGCGGSKSLSAPTNVKFDGNVLSWSAVEDAISYVVNINGEDKLTSITSTKVGLSNYYDQEITVKVKAVGEDVDDSEYSSSVVKPANSSLDILTFSSVDCVNGVQLVKNNLTKEHRILVEDAGKVVVYYDDVEMAKEYLSTFEGTNDGVLYVQPAFANYRANKGQTNHAVVTIPIPDTIKLDGTADGVKLRFKIGDTSKSEYSANSRFPTDGHFGINLLGTTGNPTLGYGYFNIAEENTFTDPYKEKLPQHEWIEWEIPFSELTKVYHEGDTEFAFAIYNTGRVYMDHIFRVDVFVDYLGYYKN